MVALEGGLHSGKLLNSAVFLFTDYLVAEGAYYLGISASKL
jgi:hypothetical protein